MKIGDFRTMVPVVKARSTGGTEDFFFFLKKGWHMTHLILNMLHLNFLQGIHVELSRRKCKSGSGA